MTRGSESGTHNNQRRKRCRWFFATWWSGGRPPNETRSKRLPMCLPWLPRPREFYHDDDEGDMTLCGESGTHKDNSDKDSDSENSPMQQATVSSFTTSSRRLSKRVDRLGLMLMLDARFGHQLHQKHTTCIFRLVLKHGEYKCNTNK
jgi:hypothetical protein